MKPYYEDAMVQLYHGDTREVLPELALQADACLTDPPYGETSLPWDRWPHKWPELVARHTSSMWCFGSFRMFTEWWLDFAEAGWSLSQDVVWEKHNGTSFAADRFKRVHELAAHFYRGRWDEVHHEAVREAYHGPDKHARAQNNRGRHYGAIGAQDYLDDGRRMVRSVIKAMSVRGGIHPTEKPAKVLAPLIEYAAPAGGLVLDPFAGSGSTLDGPNPRPSRHRHRGVGGVLRARREALVRSGPVLRRCGMTQRKPLKRTPMPPREKPMQRGSLRSTPPAQGSGKPASPRRTGKHVGEAAARKAVAERSGGDCEVRLFGICLGRATNWHHRQNRSQQGKWSPANGLHVCGSGTTGCHGALTNTNGRRKEFEQCGWIVPSHLDPAAVDCLIYTRWFGHDYVLLREDGGVDLAPFPKGKLEHPDDLVVPREPDGLGGVA